MVHWWPFPSPQSASDPAAVNQVLPEQRRSNGAAFSAGITVCDPRSQVDRTIGTNGGSPIIFVPTRPDCWSEWVRISSAERVVVEASGDVTLMLAGGDELTLKGTGKRDAGPDLRDFRVRGPAGQTVIRVR